MSSFDFNITNAQAAQKLARCRALCAAGTPAQAELAQLAQLAQQAAEQCLTCQHATGAPLRAAVTLLCELGARPEPELVRLGSDALFREVIERLNDSFAPESCAAYDRVFAQVIEFYRRLPAARELDARLRQFGLPDEAALLARKAKLAHPRLPAHDIRKVLLLSRVTIGADVAITSVLLAGARQHYPQAEIVLLGSAKLRELFGGAARIRVRELPYERGGTVLARLQSWLAVVTAIEDEARDCAPSELLVLDPDSRLTQLGLLPVLADETRYLFFESRRFGHETDLPLGQLTARWWQTLSGAGTALFPQLALPGEHTAFGQTVARKLRAAGQQHLVSLSFGVGGNAAKRVNAEFEAALLPRLLQASALILDKGGAPDERAQIDALTAALRTAGRQVLELNAENAAAKLADETGQPVIVTWDGSIGAFAGLIAASDQYIGYDSAGQHLAAALGIPALTIFVNGNSTRFAERWRPSGRGVSKVVQLPIEQLAQKQGTDNLLAKVLTLSQKLRQGSPAALTSR
ncbi:MAG: glycosyltransferase family 9 protein [Acidobacteria bacterium]|nr:glycosyltransferase family 9 protein [Acidobacteriota bacterium]MBI3421710.1 glycosyltransferase family 9 protein [Acidobacteriota bacterium]